MFLYLYTVDLVIVMLTGYISCLIRHSILTTIPRIISRAAMIWNLEKLKLEQHFPKNILIGMKNYKRVISSQGDISFAGQNRKKA